MQKLFTYLCAVALVSVAGGARAKTHDADNLPVHDANALPDLGMAPETNEGEKRLAAVVKAFGEKSMQNTSLKTGEQARQFAFENLHSTLTKHVSSEAESLLSPLGNASFNLLINREGEFTGSSGSLFTPWQDNNRYLTWSQLGVIQRSDGLVGNAGVGQRWIAGDWLLGYNTFYDSRFDDSLQRTGVGAEAWGEYLHLSANYYTPLGGWRRTATALQQRLARGYDLTAKAWLPFYRHISTTLSVEQYFGNNASLVDSGERDPVAVKIGMNYTPVPLVTLTAQHRQGNVSISQNNLALRVNYRFGVPLAKQLSASEVAQTTSLRGSRYDGPERNTLPEVAFRKAKTLSVFLATPPWELRSGETVVLKLQVNSANGIRAISWQGDTQTLSLTPPAAGLSADGWTVIVPPWNDAEGASNKWRLSATVEDNRGRKVSSNVITLTSTVPLTAAPEHDERYDLLPLD